MKIDRQQDAGMDRLLGGALGPAAPAQAGDCPTSGDFAAFVEGSLGAAERHRLEEHFSACGNCQQALAAIARMPSTDAARPVPVRGAAPLARWLRWLVPAGATVALLLAYLALSQPKRAQPEMELARSEAPASVQPPAQSRPSGPPPQPPSATASDAPAPTVLEKSERARRAVPKREPSVVAPAAPRAVTPPMAGSPAGQPRRGALAEGQIVAREAPAEKRAEAAARPGAVVDNLAFLQAAAKPTADAAPGVPSKAQVAAVPEKAQTALTPAPARPASPAGAAGQPPAAALRVGTVAESVVFRTAVPAAQNLPGGGLLVVAPDRRTEWRFDRGMAIWRTLDGGTSWKLQRPATTGEVLAGSSPDATTCWVVGREGLVLVTVDGERWETRSFVEKVDLVGVSARDARTATVTARDGRRFTTTDGGATWQPSKD